MSDRRVTSRALLAPEAGARTRMSDARLSDPLSDAARLLRGGAPIDTFLAMLDEETREALTSALVGKEETWWTVETRFGRGLPYLVPSWARTTKGRACAVASEDMYADDWETLRKQNGFRAVKVLVRRAK